MKTIFITLALVTLTLTSTPVNADGPPSTCYMSLLNQTAIMSSYTNHNVVKKMCEKAKIWNWETTFVAGKNYKGNVLAPHFQHPRFHVGIFEVTFSEGDWPMGRRKITTEPSLSELESFLEKEAAKIKGEIAKINKEAAKTKKEAKKH